MIVLFSVLVGLIILGFIFIFVVPPSQVSPLKDPHFEAKMLTYSGKDAYSELHNSAFGFQPTVLGWKENILYFNKNNKSFFSYDPAKGKETPIQISITPKEYYQSFTLTEPQTCEKNVLIEKAASTKELKEKEGTIDTNYCQKISNGNTTVYVQKSLINKDSDKRSFLRIIDGKEDFIVEEPRCISNVEISQDGKHIGFVIGNGTYCDADDHYDIELINLK